MTAQLDELYSSFIHPQILITNCFINQRKTEKNYMYVFRLFHTTLNIFTVCLALLPCHYPSSPSTKENFPMTFFAFYKILYVVWRDFTFSHL